MGDNLYNHLVWISLFTYTLIAKLGFYFFTVKVMKFQRERNLPDCYTVVDNNFQMDVEGEVGYRCVRKSHLNIIVWFFLRFLDR